MTDRASQIDTSEIVELGTTYSLNELSRVCGVEVRWLDELVEYGIIEPAGADPQEWRFASMSVVRIATAQRLERDLSLNTAGIALALELIDELQQLRRQLRATQSRVTEGQEQ